MNNSSIELLNYLSGGYYNLQLNFNSVIRRKDNLVNYYSSGVDNCYSTIAINYLQPIYDDDVIGINCFDELLLRSEFISYARKEFNHKIYGEKLLFFSKRLNLYVCQESWKAYIYSLNDHHLKEIGFCRSI